MKLRMFLGIILEKFNHNRHNSTHFRALGDGSDVDNDNTQGLLNDTDSELSSLSHVDAPNDVIYMVCGVVIAMLLVGIIIVLVAVTINKLRKREETSVSPVNVESQTTTNGPTQIPSQVLSADHTGQQLNGTTPIAYRQNPSSVWVFPPLPPQPNIYNCTNHLDALSHVNDKSGFKGFRKQFSGRFKRLVAKKAQEPAPAIPPELKPQLKTIYVY